MSDTSYRNFVEAIGGIVAATDDSTKYNQDRAKNATGQIVTFQNTFAHATATNVIVFPLDVTASPMFVADRQCRLVRAHYCSAVSVTASNTDHFLLTIVRRKSSTWSVTQEMARLAGTVTTTWTGYLRNNKAYGENPFTLHSLSASLELAKGDNVSLVHSHVGAGGVSLVQRGVLVMEFA